MNTTIRSTVSPSIALGLASFTVTSALVSGVAAPGTLAAFGLLAVYGMIEIAVLSYQGPRLISLARAGAKTSRHPARVGQLIGFPMNTRLNLARAA